MPDVYVDIFEFPDGTQVHFKDDRVDNLPKPMVYKGTLGTGGTITTLPVDGSATVGDTYKVITAGTYAGVDADIGDMFVCQTKTSSTNTWDHIPSGDDQGGHEIADDTGTILPQEPVMQFVGTYSEDDNTNNKTKVNVVRSMTKNQFDQLSEAEKKGFINITDLTSGSDDRFQPVIYSTDEREIGVWIDGKPLYERVVDLGSDTNISYEAWTLTSVSLSSIDRLVCIQSLNSSGTAYYGDLLGGNNNGYLQLLTSRNGTYVSVRYLIFRYTKTTDTPGSGQWTPQGVPAVHYSTDEQIVGTWIDGSTLYEKTFFLSQRTPITNDYTTYIIDDITIYDIDNIISCEVFDSNSDSAPLTKLAYLERAIDVIESNNKLIAFYNANNTYKMTGFILRYTKSSS